MKAECPRALHPPSKGAIFALLLLITPLVALHIWIGWGHWGYSTVGDYCLDLADALRVHQGDIPYRDFIPTYGALHMYLIAPLFGLGHVFFPVLWCLTAVAIAIQAGMLLVLGQRFFSPIWLATLLVLALGAMAFAPTNSKFIMGYSQSGFLGSFLLTAAIFALFARPPSVRRWFLGGACLGLLPFTKMDIGIVAPAAAFAICMVWFSQKRGASLALGVGFLTAWLLGCAVPMVHGAQLRLLVESALEPFQVSANLFQDPLLAARLNGVLLVGFVLMIGLLMPPLRRVILPLWRALRPFSAFIFPFAIAVDSFRTLYLGDLLKHLVALNWMWFMIWTLLTASIAATVIRTRSLRPLRFGGISLLLPLMLFSAMAFLRVHGCGWYPLNYFQPSALLLGAYWLSRQSRFTPHLVRKPLQVALALSIALLFVGSVRHGYKPSSVLSFVGTPFGKVSISCSAESQANLQRVLSLLPVDFDHEYLLCTYEPSYYVLTGMKSASFYTYFNRLGYLEEQNPERERQTLRLIMARRPAFILKDREGGAVHRRFGIEYGKAILAHIRQNYEIVEQVDGTTIYQRKGFP